MSVRSMPGYRFRHWCSSRYLRIPPLHLEFRTPLIASSYTVFNDLSQLSRELSRRTVQPPARALRPVIPDNARHLRITAAAGT